MVKHHPRPDSQRTSKLLPLARQMRREPTPAEDRLWQLLRARQLDGYKFQRQRLIGRFIVDFYCAKAALIVEVDGKVHQQQVEADLERQCILTALGFRVIRFTNDQVLNAIDQVLHHIRQALGGSNLNQLSAFSDTPSLKSGFDDFGEGAGG